VHGISRIRAHNEMLIPCKCTEEEDIDKCVCIPKAVRIGNQLAFLASTLEIVLVQYLLDDKEQ